MNHKRKIFVCFLLFAVHYSLFGQQHKVDSLYTLLKTAKEDTGKVVALNALADQLDVSQQYRSSDSVAAISAHLAEKLNFKRGEANAFLEAGFANSDAGRGPEGIKNCMLAVEVAKQIADSSIMSNAYHTIGSIYTLQGNYPEALANDLLSLNIEEARHNKARISSSLINIGNIYYDQANYDEAINYYNKALVLCKQIDRKHGMISAYENIGNVYVAQNKYAEALDNFSDCLQVLKQIDDRSAMVNVYASIGYTYMQQAKLTEALQSYRYSLSYARQIHSAFGIGYAYSGIGIILIDLKKYTEARNVLDSALSASKAVGDKNTIKTIYEAYTNLDSATGNYKEAYHDFRLSIAYRDSLTNEANTKKIVREQMQFEFDKKQTEEKATQEKKDLAEQESKKRQSILIYSITGVLLLVIAFTIFVVIRMRITHRQKRIIEIKSKETEEQKKVIEEKNKDILDSITYAQRIQKALLASDALLKENLPEYFVLFKPKDIVSGDFYWATVSNGRFYLAACDSTGHGVPGAFMSLLNISYLNEGVSEKKITEPNEVFNHARKRLIENISQDGQQDGMDGILASLRPSEGGIMLNYAAAYNLPVIVRNGTLIELPADKIPVGKSPMENTPFTLHTAAVNKGDCLYLFTDGYPDQFGGPKGKKYKYKQLQQLFAKVAELPMNEQKEILEKEFEAWRGELEQTDDVCIIGIRI